MATHRINILGAGTLPDTSGNVYQEPAALNLLSNDRFSHMVYVFKDTATKISLGGTFKVPENYVGTPVITATWGTTATTGDVVWDFDSKAIADGESLDPSSDDDTATTTVTVPGTARLAKVTNITLSGTYVSGDLVEFNFSRDGASGSDTLAASAYLEALEFKYADV